MASICLILSLVTENCNPTSSNVWSVFIPIPKRILRTLSSLGVRVAKIFVVDSPKLDLIEASRGLVDSYKDDFGDFEVEIWPEIEEHSPYDGTNPYDLMYISRVRDALKAKGFDGVKGMDVVSNYEIPIFIPLDTSQFTLREPTEITSSPYERKYEGVDS